jgi:hypothetical protein
VPFFRDLQVHVLASGNGGDTTVRAGWSVGVDNFFNNITFDAGNRGLPPSVTLANYEDTSFNSGIYNPHAKQTWLGVLDFDFPLAWDALGRRFVSTTPVEEPFLVFTSQRVVSQLSPSGADLRFGLQFQGLPRVNLAGLVVDEGELTKRSAHHQRRGCGDRPLPR